MWVIAGNQKMKFELHIHSIILALFDWLVSMLGRQQTLRGYPHCKIYITIIKFSLTYSIQKHWTPSKILYKEKWLKSLNNEKSL